MDRTGRSREEELSEEELQSYQNILLNLGIPRIGATECLSRLNTKGRWHLQTALGAVVISHFKQAFEKLRIRIGLNELIPPYHLIPEIASRLVDMAEYVPCGLRGLTLIIEITDFQGKVYEEKVTFNIVLPYNSVLFYLRLREEKPSTQWVRTWRAIGERQIMRLNSGAGLQCNDLPKYLPSHQNKADLHAEKALWYPPRLRCTPGMPFSLEMTTGSCYESGPGPSLEMDSVGQPKEDEEDPFGDLAMWYPPSMRKKEKKSKPKKSTDFWL